MKREAGAVTASVVAVAALFGASSLQIKPGANTSALALQQRAAAGAHERKLGKPEPGPCDKLQDLFVDFFSLKSKAAGTTASFAPSSCNDESKDTSNIAVPDALRIRVVLATLPDPIHTNTPLGFDRYATSIQQAALAAGYNYDSSWLPWQSDRQSYALLADQDKADTGAEAREDQPGVLLFRKQLPSGANSVRTARPYQDTLVVLIVGEAATSGIHRAQFKHAVDWIKLLKGLGSPPPEAPPVQLLGPAFSGSLSSLDELLRDPDTAETLRPPTGELQVYSGQITNKTAADWFRDAHGNDAVLPVRFHSFQQDRETVTRLYLQFLDSIGVAGCHLSIVSEDETAFGSDNSTTPAPPPANLRDCAPPAHTCTFCGRSYPTAPARNPAAPTHFYYPRDISALRAAYQEQALFSRSGSQSADTPRRTLRDDLSASTTTEPDLTDTIHSYGGSQTALTEEASLLQIVSMMRAHRTQFILLISSNSLDQIFLTKFFKLTYPEGRVAILGNDLLLRRDAASSGMTGVTTLGAWPLLPEIDHWTRKFHSGGDSHLHLAFPQSEAQGDFVALRFLLAPQPPPGCLAAQDKVIFLPPNCNQIDVPDYRYPFWLKPVTDPDDDTAQVPVTWLSVIANDGFWPVASLDVPSFLDGAPLPRQKAWESSNPPNSPPSALATLWNSVAGNLHTLWCRTPNTHFRDLPLSMNVCICLVLLWACFHLAVHSAPSVTVKPTHRTSFVRLRRLVARPLTSSVHPYAHIALVVLGSFLLSLIATLLAWAYGWLSPDGPIVYYPAFYAFFPMLIWTMGFCAVFANTWVEHRLEQQAALHVPAPPRHPSWIKALFPVSLAPLRQTLRTTLAPLAAYVLASFAFFCFFLLYIDNQLTPEVRTLTYLRAVNLTTGVSPVVPLVLMACGLYGWCWCALHGLCLFGDDRPVLPPDECLGIVYKDPTTGRNTREFYLTMLGSTHAGDFIERLCAPFSWTATGIFFAILFVLGLADAILAGGVPIRSLGTDHYAVVVSVWLALLIAILLTNVWQIARLWLRLREMLVFLDRLPIRRTLQAMRGFSWDSIWKMGGNVLDIRYRLFYRQFETLNHLKMNLELFLENKAPAPPLSYFEWEHATRCLTAIEASAPLRRTFARWYARHWDDWTARDLSDLKAVQLRTATLAALMLTKILVPAWNAEKNSLLVLPPGAAESTDLESEHMRTLVEDLPPHIRDAEEIVCLVYLGFIQNILGRIRSFVLGMIALFLAIAFVVPSYPFDPRPLLTGSVIALFLVVGLAVFSVYSQMFRDATLSHLTNTKPGELGSDFWLKFIGFGIGPIVGLLATIFPQLSGFISSWLAPGISSLK